MRTVRMFAAAGVSLLAIASPAMAQDTAAKDSEETSFVSGDIVVEARRRDESVQDVPLVVQAVTAQDLADLNIREFQDIQTLVPGLSLSQSANGIGTQASIRGIAYDVNASGNNGTIEFYMNDAHLSSGMLFQSMFDVQQIEVLRGPQGTLRGRASPSGSITVTTTRPNLSEAGGYASGQINDLGGWNINGAINVPVIEDKLGIRIAGVVDESHDTRITSINNPTAPKSQMEGIRVSALFEPVDGLRLSGNYTTTTRDVTTFDQVESLNIADPGAPASPVTIRANDRLSALSVPRTYKQEFEIYQWAAEYRAFGQKLNYVGAVNNQSIRSFDPDDPGAAYLAAGFPASFAATGLLTNTDSKEQFHEVRLSSDERVAGIFDYVVGYLYNKLESPSNLSASAPLVNTLPVPIPLAPGFFLPANAQIVISQPILRGGGSTEESFFANINAHIGDATEISGGLRYITYKNDGFLNIGGNVTEDPLQDLNHTIYTASIKHNFTDSFMAYASFGTSWRPGSATNGIILARSGLDVPNASPEIQSFMFPGAETSESYEIGFKSDWLDRRLRVNVTAYHQDFKNYAYSSTNVYVAGPDVEGAEGVFLVDPAFAVGVPVKVDGVEAEIAFQATPQWSMNAVLSYSKSKIKNGTIPCNDFSPADGVPDSGQDAPALGDFPAGGIATCQIGYRAGRSAPFNMTFQSEYNHPISNSLDGYVRGLLTYYGDSQNDPANDLDDVKDYGLVNLFAGIRGPEGAWDIGFYGKNIFDVFRVLDRDPSPLGASYTAIGATGRDRLRVESTYRGVSINNPREFGVTFRANFGSR